MFHECSIIMDGHTSESSLLALRGWVGAVSRISNRTIWLIIIIIIIIIIVRDCTGALLVMVLSSVSSSLMTIRPIILLFLKNKGLACEEDSVFKHSTCVNKTIRQADGRGEGGGGSTVCRKKSGRVLLMMESWMDDGGGMQMNGFAWPEGRILIPFVTN